MRKDEFIDELSQHLEGFSEEEIRQTVEYYSEMIDECVENGMDETSAVAAQGQPELIAAQIKCEPQSMSKNTPQEKFENFAPQKTEPVEFGNQSEENANNGNSNENQSTNMNFAPGESTPKNTSTAIIVLLILGFPIWFSLLIAALCILFSLYIAMLSVVFSLWCVFVSLAAFAVACAAGAAITFCTLRVPEGLFCLGVTLICTALAIFAYIIALVVSKAMARFIKFTFKKFFGIFKR